MSKSPAQLLQGLAARDLRRARWHVVAERIVDACPGADQPQVRRIVD